MARVSQKPHIPSSGTHTQNATKLHQSKEKRVNLALHKTKRRVIPRTKSRCQVREVCRIPYKLRTRRLYIYLLGQSELHVGLFDVAIPKIKPKKAQALAINDRTLMTEGLDETVYKKSIPSR